MFDILVVEDSKVIQKRMAAVLSQAGYEVDTCSNGKEALEKISTHEPRLVFIDLIMPVMDGYTLLKSLKSNHPDVKRIVVSATPKKDAWSEVNRLGANEYIQKPTKDEELVSMVNRFLNKKEEVIYTPEIVPGPEDQPFETHIKACYVCGYDKVKVYLPKKGATEEDWTNGLYPLFKAKPPFKEWDFLKTLVSVCPSCLFASSDPMDFSLRGLENEFPYKLDSKKVLTMGMSARKRLIGSNAEIDEDTRFDKPNRDLELVLESLRLAEKCANGLVLGDKKTAYSQIGYYCALQAMLKDGMRNEKLREALVSFNDQLKITETSRETIVMAYYFKIALHIALGESIAANEEKEQLENFYAKNNPDLASPQELEWNQRLLNVWKNGFDASVTREIMRH
jgi:CheY-like chemotaxis protein